MKVVKPVCNICTAVRAEKIREGVFGSPTQNVYRCLVCGHTFLAPFDDDMAEEDFYTSHYPAYLVSRGDTRSQSPEKHFRDNRSEADRRLKTVRHLLSDDRTVLEIGSATGFFLHRIHGRVKEVCGVEPNTTYRDYANRKGITTFPSLIDLDGRRFDLVFLYYVLEHIRDPRAFLTQIVQLLSGPEARIVIEVPNVDESLVSLYKCKAYDDFVWQKAHCSYYSVAVLRSLLTQVGLEGSFTPVQRYDISNHLYWLAEGKPGGMGKYSNVLSRRLTDEYRRNLEKGWLCDTILATSRPITLA